MADKKKDIPKPPQPIDLDRKRIITNSKKKQKKK